MPYGSFRREGFRRFDGPREMHKIKCSACGKEAEVPFRPKEGLPVYCKECYLKKKGIKEKPKEEEVEEVAAEPEEMEESEDTEEEF